MRLGRWGSAAVALTMALCTWCETAAGHGERSFGWFGVPNVLRDITDLGEAGGEEEGEALREFEERAVAMLRLDSGASLELAGSETAQQRRIRAGIGDGVGQRGVAHAGSRLIEGATLPIGETRSTGYVAIEPTLGVFKDGTIVYMGAGDLIDGDDKTYPQVAALLRSRDEGRTWQELDPLVVGSKKEQAGEDPFVRVDRDTGRMFQLNYGGACTPVSMSDDEGDTFSTGAICNHTDHQNLFTGKPVTSTTSGYPKVVYYCAIDGGTLEGFNTLTACSKSLDGGLTFVRTGAPPYVGENPTSDGGYAGTGHCGGSTGHGVTDAAGTIFLPRGFCGQPFVAISHDEGLSWERVQVASNGVPADSTLGHEASMAVDAAGNLYYTWVAADRLPYLVTSRDHGATWSAPVRISPPNLNETWGAFVDAGAPGRIAVSYVATTNSPGGPFCVRPMPPFAARTDCATANGDPPHAESEYAKTTWDGYISETVDALSPDPVFLTAAVTPRGDPLLRGGKCVVLRCDAEFDFLDTEIAPDGTPWAAFVDACDKETCVPAGVEVASIGVGVAARLTGGPPLYGPLAESAKPPLVLPPPGNAPAKCASRRRFTIRLRAPHGERLRSARVLIAGRAVKVARRNGRLSATIDLRGLERGRFTIRIIARTTRGREARFKRTYRTCTKNQR